MRAVTKRYGSVTAVDAVDLDVNEGEIFGLLGANGAGKTTAVECAQGLRRRDAGDLRVLGLDPERDRARLRPLVGSQLQESALPDRMRVGEAVALFADGGGRRGEAALERWGLLAQRKTPFAKLSGGQKQRLFVALALQNAPQVVFLDELTQGLDPAARRETWGIIEEVRDAGTTVVLVTHFVDEAEALCDRVAVMAAGRVSAIGTPVELTRRFSDRATVSFSTDGPPPDLDGLPGVLSVGGGHGVVEVVGTTDMIAHVCAALVASGSVPADLRVQQATLEDAVLALLGRAP